MNFLDNKPFIIAEVGSNFTSREDCLASLQAAKACGAHAVKFQLFDHKALYGVDGEIRGALPVVWLGDLKKKCDSLGLEFMCSAFSPEFYEVINPLVKIHKVASAELTHVRILEKLKTFKKPVILSTGASGLADIGRALEILGDTPVVLMYCVASYPAKVIHLECIELLAKTFKKPVGYSDHSLDALAIPRAAVSHGAQVIEKHFKFKDDIVSPDAEHSLNPQEFALMVAGLKGVKETINPSPEENDMVLKSNRRLIATKDIKAGDIFRENQNFGIYRSLVSDTHAFSPFAINRVEGQVAKKDIKLGMGIGPGDI